MDDYGNPIFEYNFRGAPLPDDPLWDAYMISTAAYGALDHDTFQAGTADI